MTLGQNITRLRTARGLSQGALAEELGVSRQSVSKWETDSSVPELDKLIKMAKLFEVTLDELVTGEAAPAAAPPPPQVVVVERKRETRKTVGFVFLVLALFCLLSGNVFLQILAAPPFLVMGLICLAVRWHPGICCMWAVGFMADTYLRFGTGLSWRTVGLTFWWTAEMNWFRLAVAWAQLIGMVAIMVLTIALWDREEALPKVNRGFLLGYLVLALALPFLLKFIMAGHYVDRFWSAFIEWPIMALIAAAVVKLLRRRKKTVTDL